MKPLNPHLPTIIRLLDAGHHPRYISRHLSIPYHTITTLCRKHNLPTNRSVTRDSPFESLVTRALLLVHLSHLTYDEAAAIFRFSSTYLRTLERDLLSEEIEGHGPIAALLRAHNKPSFHA